MTGHTYKNRSKLFGDTWQTCFVIKRLKQTIDRLKNKYSKNCIFYRKT